MQEKHPVMNLYRCWKQYKPKGNLGKSKQICDLWSAERATSKWFIQNIPGKANELGRPFIISFLTKFRLFLLPDLFKPTFKVEPNFPGIVRKLSRKIADTLHPNKNINIILVILLKMPETLNYVENFFGMYKRKSSLFNKFFWITINLNKKYQF